MITLILGPMFSSKSTEMLRLLERAHIANHKVILLRPKLDTRPFLSRFKKDALWLKQEFVDLDNFDASDYSVIGVEEGQFCKNLKEFCCKYSLMGKHIIVAALHATSESEMFEPVIDLLPHCENIIKLNAVCTECGSDYANYSYYLAGKEKSEKIVVGDSEYTALCAKCYHNKK